MKIVNKNILASNLFDDMVANNALISYFGALDFEVTNQLIKGINVTLKSKNILPSVYKKIYSSFAEGIENAYKHQKNVRDDSPGIVLCSLHKNFIEITIGNPIELKDRVLLMKKIDEILETDEVILSEQIRSKLLLLNHSTDTTSAKIGLMRIGLNAQKNIKYVFKELQNGELFFMLNFRINLN
ncbi:MAG: hypothetical protein JKY30_05385 [Flavobacteriales bacterium]|nr:hypothetical protein [Flavobacteriales bacterium]